MLIFLHISAILYGMAKDAFDDDRSLVEACLKKDAAAWELFVNKYSRLIFISIDIRLRKYGFTPAAHDIEEIRQALLTSIWRDGKLKSVRNRRGISYWLAIVSGNAAIEYMREARRDEFNGAVSLSRPIGEGELADLLPSPGATPTEELSRKEALKNIERAIASLPVKEKLIAKLNILHGKNYREAAKMLRLPEGTVASYVKRAKERLRKILKYLQ
jgi:RNA polymerase sigma factor (sigma-70 family)